MSRRLVIFVVSFVSLLVLSCGLGTSAPTTPAPTSTSAPTPSPSATDTPEPTATATVVPATDTQEPTALPSPTSTPLMEVYPFEDTAGERQLRSVVGKPHWPLIFSEDYSEHWGIVPHTSCAPSSIYYSQGECIWDMPVGDGIDDCVYREFSLMEPGKAYSDFAAGVWADERNGVDSAHYGVLFRIESVGSNVHAFYMFALNEQEGARLWFFDGRECTVSTAADCWTPLSQPKGAALVNPEGENFLAVMGEGPVISCYLNGQLVDQVEVSRLETGRLGLYARIDGDSETPGLFAFDNFVGLAPAHEVVEEPGESDQEDGSLPEGWRWTIVENFDDVTNPNDWPLGMNQDDFVEIEYSIADGAYVWDVTSLQNMIHRRFPGAVGEFDDVAVVVNLRMEEGPSNACSGIVFRESRGNYYYYSVNDLGWVRLLLFTRTSGWQLLAEKQVPLTPLTLRTLGVAAEGDNIRCLLGDEIVFSVVNDTLHRGRVGLAVELMEANQEAVVAFDSFYVAAYE